MEEAETLTQQQVMTQVEDEDDNAAILVHCESVVSEPIAAFTRDAGQLLGLLVLNHAMIGKYPSCEHANIKVK